MKDGFRKALVDTLEFAKDAAILLSIIIVSLIFGLVLGSAFGALNTILSSPTAVF